MEQTALLFQHPHIRPQAPGRYRFGSRQHFAKFLPLFPDRHRRCVMRARNVHGLFDQPHLMNITGAIRKNAVGSHANDELSTLEFRQQRIGIAQRRFTILEKEPGRVLEVDKQQSDPRVHKDITKAAIHPIAVIVRKGQRAIINDPHEARQPALV